MCAFAKFGRHSSRYPKSSVRLRISSRLRASPAVRRLLGAQVGTLMSRIVRAPDGLRAIEDNDSIASTIVARRSHVKVVGGADGRSH